MDRKNILTIAIICLALVGLAFFTVNRISNSGEEERGFGILAGKVTIGPLCPVEPCPGTVPNPYTARQIIASKKTGEVFHIPLNADGSFVGELPDGTYSIDLTSCSYLGCKRSLPREIIIEENKTLQVSIDIDTGIR